MKGDFSRIRFNRTKHYTAVLEQQGRVALDADSNEQVAINQDLRETEIVDVVGPFGGPQGNEGFGISLSGNTIQIGGGRYYVAGILCEGPALSYMQQPFLIGPAASDAQMLADLQKGASSAIQIFLEVWQRLGTALDDPCLLEPALGGPDTTARLQTVWRVVAQPIAASTGTSGSKLGTFQGPLTGVFTREVGISLPPNISISTTGIGNAGTGISTTGGTSTTGTTGTTTTGTTGTTTTTGSTGASTTQPPAPIDCCVSMYQQPLSLLSGRLSAQTSGATSDCSCEPTPAAGYRGLENQLYRVEIYQGGPLGKATFVWSRENGSVRVGVTNASGSQVQVESLGPDANLGFTPGQWVEITDDTFQFGPVANQPGQLYQIQSVTPAQSSVTVTPPIHGIDTTRNARMRRWDQFGVGAGPAGMPTSASWIELENGIQVQFAAGNYATGDYWLITARTASGSIDWPPCGSDGAAFQPPHNTVVHRAPLACIHWVNNQQFIVEDCRRSFPPLTAVSGGALTALHVAKINWNNDDVVAFDQVLATGLTISLDQAPTSHIDASTFALSLEIPVISQVEPLAVSSGLAPIVLRTVMALDGQITVNKTDLTWNLPFRDAKGAINGIQLQALSILDLALLQGLNYTSFARARVTLLGEAVFAGSGSSQLYLDGQAFGAAGVRNDQVTPRTDLTFPSGSGAQASDFQSWFFLAPTLTLSGLTIQPPAVSFSPSVPAPPQPPVATLTVNYPALADTVVTLSVIGPAGAIPAATVPASVVIPHGKNSVTFSVGIRNTGVQAAEVFQIIASLKNALGITGTVTATLTITGTVILT